MGFPSNHRTDPFINRLQVYTLKFAMILSVVNESTVKISRESMRQAVDLMLMIHKSLAHIDRDELVFGKVQIAMKKIVDCLTKRGGQSKAFLLNYTKLTAREFDEAIDTLKQADRVTMRTVKTTGRDASYYEIKPTN
jgi:hypothetical protein